MWSVVNREFKKTTTATATGTSLNKRINEQNNTCARAKQQREMTNRPLSRGGHFESQENKKLCFCPSSLALDGRLDGQILLFQYCVIKFNSALSEERELRRLIF